VHTFDESPKGMIMEQAPANPNHPGEQDHTEVPQNWPPPPPPHAVASPKNSAVAALLTILIPGLGNIYVGNFPMGLLWFVLAAGAWVSVLLIIGVVFVPVVYFFAAFQTYMSAVSFNRRNGISVK
jgi:TM2 domain-containing membrane protein YozV